MAKTQPLFAAGSTSPDGAISRTQCAVVRRTRQSRRLSASSSAALLYQDYPGTSYEIRLLPCAAWRDFRVALKWEIASCGSETRPNQTTVEPATHSIPSFRLRRSKTFGARGMTCRCNSTVASALEGICG
jgi:hypothetical protein